MRNIVIFVIKYELPGVFQNNPAPAVNGSLWSLQHELRCYIVIGLLAMLGWLNTRVMLGLLMAMLMLRCYGAITSPSPDHVLGMKWHKLEMMVRLGSAAYFYRFSLWSHWRWLLMGVLGVIASTWLPTSLGKLLFDPSLTLVLLYLGFRPLPVIADWSRYGDFSYGIYLYAFPIQQLSWHLFPHAEFWILACFSFLVTLVCAILSWRWIEKPTLSMK